MLRKLRLRKKKSHSYKKNMHVNVMQLSVSRDYRRTFWKFSKTKNISNRRREKEVLFFSTIFALFTSLVPGFVMNYPYNDKHQQFHNLRPTNLL